MFHKIRSTVSLAAMSAVVAAAQALPQDGAFDPTFNPADGGFHGSGANHEVLTVREMADGRLMMGGWFTSYHRAPAGRVVRTLADGALDSDFLGAGTGANWVVTSVQSLPNGKSLVAGGFSSVHGQQEASLARLLADGSLDTTFAPGGSPNSVVWISALQPDGRILIGGHFTSIAGQSRSGIARLDSEGNLDPTFDPGAGLSGLNLPFFETNAFAITIQPDGRILIGGEFTAVDNTPRPYLARLAQDGSLDPSFTPTPNASVWAIALLPDGKMLVGGTFTEFDGAPNRHLVRLLPSGDLDTTFNPAFQPDGPVFALHALPDGRVYVGGGFESVGGLGRKHVARLLPDGSADSTFDLGAGLDAGNTNQVGFRVRSLQVVATGKILIGGRFGGVQGQPRHCVALLNPDGSLDPTFHAQVGADNAVSSVARRSDGTYVIVGDFSYYNGTPRHGIAALNPDGTLDAGFDPGAGLFPTTPNNGDAKSVAVLPDGRVLVGGRFTTFDGIPRGGIARILPDGSLDSTFDPGGGQIDVDDIVVLPDGRVLIGGSFSEYAGTPRRSIARILPDGSSDPTFDPGLGAQGRVRALHVLADGRILLAGNFTSYDGVSRARVARILPDGALDPTFDPGAGSPVELRSISTQADGKILIVGGFAAFNGLPRRGLVRLDFGGGVDPSFQFGTGPNVPPDLRALAIQPDGKILVGGAFSAWNGSPHRGITRLHPDGTTDTSFLPEPNSHLNDIHLQPDGRALIGGSFGLSAQGFRHGIARIQAYQPQQGFCFGDGSGAACPCGNSGAADAGCASSISAAGARLQSMGSASLTSDDLVLTGSGMPSSAALYFQGTSMQSGGAGVAFGDGLRCAAGTVVRLGTKINALGGSRYPEVGDEPISVRGAIAAPGIRTYQIWYRNAAAFCTSSTFNLSNGLRVVWEI